MSSEVFPCPNCREIINLEMTHCRFCGVAIDPRAASLASQNQAAVARACNDANYLKIMARSLIVFYLVSWVPFLGAVGWAFLILMIVIPALFIRWWIRYRALQTGDADFEGAKRQTVIAVIIWSAMFLLWLVGAVISLFLPQFPS